MQKQLIYGFNAHVLMKLDMVKRIGFVKISEETYDLYRKNPEIGAYLFVDTFILDITFDKVYGVYIYKISGNFLDVVPEGALIPYYSGLRLLELRANRKYE